MGCSIADRDVVEFNISLTENDQSHCVQWSANLTLLFMKLEAHVEYFTIDDGTTSLRSLQLTGLLRHLSEDIYHLVLQPCCP